MACILMDKNANMIKCGDYVKYSLNEIGVPSFYGVVVTENEELYVEHSNKVLVKIDEKIISIEVIHPK